jgi:hypothetical protein
MTDLPMNNQISAIEGGCLCGAIRYRATGTPYHLTHCHCSICRRASGSPFVSWLSFHSNEFAFTRGEPTQFASSEKGLRGFCNQCGTALTFQFHDADEVDVTICSLDNLEGILPEDHTWVRSQLSWVKIADGLPRYEQKRTSA